jgi:histidyl-tRNA synthetase
MEFGEKSLKSLMKSADRLGAAHVLMIGDKELDEKAALLRNMRTKEQVAVPLDGVIETLKQMKRSHDIGG